MSDPSPLPGYGPPLFVVLNAVAGRQDATAARRTMAGVFESAGRPHRFLTFGDGRELESAAREALQAAWQARGVVVAAGGDGTVNAVVQQVFHSGCRFGVVPQGTFNYFAREHGIPQETGAAAAALLRAQPAPVQVGLVNEHVFLVNASLGLYRKLLEERELAKSQLGRRRWVAMAAGLWSLLRNRPQLRLTIETADEVRSIRTPSLFIGNNRLQFDRLGLAEGAVLERGCLGAVLVRPIGTASMLGLALRGALGRLGDAEHVVSFPIQRLTVFPHHARWVKVATDGEVLRLRAPLVFRVAPQPLMLMRPSPEDRVEPA